MIPKRATREAPANQVTALTLTSKRVILSERCMAQTGTTSRTGAGGLASSLCLLTGGTVPPPVCNTARSSWAGCCSNQTL